jgi:hypothetical protein
MSSIIDFLERMGADAQLRHASKEDLAKALEESQVDAALGAAIIAHSTSADEIYGLLGLRPMFHTQEDPDRDDEDEEEGEGKVMGAKDSLVTHAIARRLSAARP